MVEFSDIQSAYERIKGVINHTPVMTSRTLNDRLGASVFFKCENFQRIGAFKFRGAFNTLCQLGSMERSKGVITHSSGNHAQALALAAKILKIKAVVVMPKNSPQVKIEATRSYDADIVMCESTIQAREDTTNDLIKKHGYTLIHPYDNDQIIAGAGTAALELMLDAGSMDMVFAPIGGGGLLSGTSIATKGFNPIAKVYGCEPEYADDAFRSLQAGTIQTNSNPNRTIADGLRTNLCDRTFKIIQKNVNQIIVVSDQQIIEAMWYLWERMKLVVEPSGAIGLAGLLSGKVDIKNKKIGIIISGGNIDLGDFFSLFQRKLSEKK